MQYATRHSDPRTTIRYEMPARTSSDMSRPVDDAMLHAALLRSLTRVVAARAKAGVPPRRFDPRSCARAVASIGFGITDRLLDLRAGRLVEAPQLVLQLLDALPHDLKAHDQWAHVRELLRGAALTAAVRVGRRRRGTGRL